MILIKRKLRKNIVYFFKKALNYELVINYGYVLRNYQNFSTSEISYCAGFNKRNCFYKKWVLIRENIHEDILRITKRKIKFDNINPNLI